MGMVSPGKRRGKARKRAGGTAGVAVVVSGRDRKPGARGAVKATPKAVPVMGMDGTLPVPSSRHVHEKLGARRGGRLQRVQHVHDGRESAPDGIVSVGSKAPAALGPRGGASAGRRGPRAPAPAPPSRPAEEISRERPVAARAEPIGRTVKALPVGGGSRNGGLARESAGTEGVRAGSAVRAGGLPGFAGQLSGPARGSVRAGGGRAGGRAGVTRLDPGVVAAGAASRGTEVPALPVPIASFLI
jgi:hypothetical protein